MEEVDNMSTSDKDRLTYATLLEHAFFFFFLYCYNSCYSSSLSLSRDTIDALILHTYYASPVGTKDTVACELMCKQKNYKIFPTSKPVFKPLSVGTDAGRDKAL